MQNYLERLEVNKQNRLLLIIIALGIGGIYYVETAARTQRYINIMTSFERRSGEIEELRTLENSRWKAMIKRVDAIEDKLSKGRQQ